MPKRKTSLHKKSLFALALGALGVVYGDIGTSPLYAISELFFGHGKVPVTPEHVIGAISLVVWILTLIVTVKYVVFVLRASYEGEGGIFALSGLLRKLSGPGIAAVSTILLLAAGLLLGDGVITPAISVLSAVEGLSVLASSLTPYIIPITLTILTLLFLVQYLGTGKIGRVFGVVMSLWFIVLAALGLNAILGTPAILEALNPYYALHFLWQIGLAASMLVFGAVVLVVTGGEALFADLGHFGIRPIRISWLFYAYPCLLLNYLGQGATLLSGNPIVNGNVFYSMVPSVLLMPMIVLATCATIIASQALISGAFSLIAQGIAQNIIPRFRIIHTSYDHAGQIYVPALNGLLFVGCIAVVLAFRTSSNLAAAYGLAETGVMLATSIAMFAIARGRWKWSLQKTLAIFGVFALLDAVFLFANSLKFLEGGYVPFGIGLVLFYMMLSWQWGKGVVARSFAEFTKSRNVGWLVDLKERLEKAGGLLDDDRGRMVEANRAVVYLTSKPIKDLSTPVPVAARLFIKRSGSIPRCIILLNIAVEKEPYLQGEGYDVQDLGANVFAVNARFGFMEEVNVRELLAELKERKLIPFTVAKCTIQVAEEDMIIDKGIPWGVAIEAMSYRLFSKLAAPTYKYFGLDADANVSTTLIPLHVTKDKASVVKLLDDDLVIG